MKRRAFLAILTASLPLLDILSPGKLHGWSVVIPPSDPEPKELRVSRNPYNSVYQQLLYQRVRVACETAISVENTMDQAGGVRLSDTDTHVGGKYVPLGSDLSWFPHLSTISWDQSKHPKFNEWMNSPNLG